MKHIFTAAAAAVIFAALLTACGGNDNSDTSAETSPSVTAESSAEPEATINAEDAVSADVFETPVEENRLLGMWVNEENSVSIQFNDDGTYVNDSIEGDYTLDGNTLTLTYYGGEVSEDYSVGFRNDQLVLVRDDFQLIFDKKNE